MLRVFLFLLLTALIAGYGALWGDHLSQRFPGCGWNLWTGVAAGLLFQVFGLIDRKFCKWYTGFSRTLRLSLLWSAFGLYLWVVSMLDQQGNMSNPSPIVLGLCVGGVLIVRLNVAQNKFYSQTQSG